MERVKLTYEDYVEIPEDGKRHEIIDGEEYVTPAPRTKHQAVVSNLHFFLKAYVRSTGAGVVFDAPTDVVLSETDVVQPDLIFISKANKRIVTELNIRGTPDLLVEVISEGSSRNDEVIKKKRYEYFRVPEYWIVDPEQQTVKVFRLQKGAYGNPQVFTSDAGGVLTSPQLPGFEASLSDIFAL
jgi:Uma2 family endonuclease